MKYKRTTEQKPYDRVLFCGICGLEIHVTRGDMEGPHGWTFSEDELELRAEEHLSEHHAFRFWLWRATGRSTEGWRKKLVGGLVA